MRSDNRPYGWLLAAIIASVLFYFIWGWAGSDIVHIFDRGSLWDRLNGILAVGGCICVALYGFSRFAFSFFSKR